MANINQDTIAEIRSFVNPILNEISGSDIRRINLKDIEIAEGMKFNNIPLSTKAMKTVLMALSIKPQFLNYQEKLTPQDWSLIGKKLKEARGDVEMFANVLKPGNSAKNEIYSLVLKNQKKKAPDLNTNMSNVVDLIEEALGMTQIHFSLAGTNFNETNNLISLDLRNDDFSFAPFQGDEWKKGSSFKFNSLTFQNLPMLERLFCTNGMTTKNYGFASNIGQNRFNEIKIMTEIRKSLITNETHIEEIVNANLKRLKNFNVSVAEFLAWKKQISNFGDGYEDISDKYLNEAPLFAAYKSNIEDKPMVWKRTADSGINAYNLLNLITWIASHPTESKVDEKAASALKISAGNYLFKKVFDLERIAEKVKVDYPLISEMQ